MKKILTLAILLQIFNLHINAQDKYLGLTGGITNPTGSFSGTEFNNSESGYAQNGYNFSLDMAFYFNDYVGLGANLRFSNCEFDSEVFNNALEERFMNEMDTISFSSSKYNLQNFLIGPYGKINLGDYLSIYGKTFIGVLTTFWPTHQLVYREYGGELVTEESLPKYHASFAYNLGAGVLLKLNERLGFNLSADYISGKPSLEFVNPETLEITAVKKPVQFLDYNFGIVLLF
ncbi:MAG: outer membrane beta-barrel protein [Bacteroidales bacterium]